MIVREQKLSYLDDYRSVHQLALTGITHPLTIHGELIIASASTRSIRYDLHQVASLPLGEIIG